MRGSGRKINLRGDDAPIFAASSEPEALFSAAGLPPLMLTPIGLFPSPPVVPDPGFVAEPAFPGAPGFPSGDMEIRAAAFPGGGCTGAGGPGVAERAMSAFALPLVAVNCVEPTSGAGAASPLCARG